MFSAIVTALVGMTFLAGIGVLDLALITVPETFLWPQLVGGLLLGAGFIVSGYCPGTGVVAIASGNLDGVAAIGGIMLGSLAFGFGYGPLEGFYKSGAMGVVRIDRLLGVPDRRRRGRRRRDGGRRVPRRREARGDLRPAAGRARPGVAGAREGPRLLAASRPSPCSRSPPSPSRRAAARPRRERRRAIGPLELARELVDGTRDALDRRPPPRRRRGEGADPGRDGASRGRRAGGVRRRPRPDPAARRLRRVRRRRPAGRGPEVPRRRLRPRRRFRGLDVGRD